MMQGRWNVTKVYMGWGVYGTGALKESRGMRYMMNLILFHQMCDAIARYWQERSST